MGPIPSRHYTGLELRGGATRVARLLAEGLTAAGHPADLRFEVAEQHGAPTSPAAFGTGLPPDVLPHLHCTGDWPALLGSLPENRTVVVTLHDAELLTGGCPYPLDCAALDDGCDPCPRNFPHAADLRRRNYHLLHRLDAHLAAPSRWLARLAKVHLHRPVTIIPNGIPWPDTPPRRDEARRRLGIHTAARVVLFTAHGGENAPYKHGGEWRDIWNRIRARVPGTLCFFVGGDQAAHHDDLVVWPYVDRDRLATLMAAADLLVHPSRAENHSLVILEAMANALPVAAFAVGGVPEQITDNETGTLAPPDQLDELAQQAAQLLTTPTLCRELGRNAFSFGQKRFTTHRMVADYLRLYQSLDTP